MSACAPREPSVQDGDRFLSCDGGLRPFGVPRCQLGELSCVAHADSPRRRIFQGADTKTSTLSLSLALYPISLSLLPGSVSPCRRSVHMSACGSVCQPCFWSSLLYHRLRLFALALMSLQNSLGWRRSSRRRLQRHRPAFRGSSLAAGALRCGGSVHAGTVCNRSKHLQGTCLMLHSHGMTCLGFFVFAGALSQRRA